jgi:hypothetical protein
MAILLVAAAGILTGWVIGIVADMSAGRIHSKLLEELDQFRPEDDDLVDWEQYTSGGRRG